MYASLQCFGQAAASPLVGDPKQQLLCAIPLAIIADAISTASLTLKRFCMKRNVQGNTFATLLVAPSRDDYISLCRWLVSSHHPVWVEEGGRTTGRMVAWHVHCAAFRKLDKAWKERRRPSSASSVHALSCNLDD